MPRASSRPARSSANVSLTTALDGAHPCASIAAWIRFASTGRSALARQAETCSTSTPPVAEREPRRGGGLRHQRHETGHRTIRSDAMRLEACAPRDVEDRAVRGDDRDVGLAVARVDGQDSRKYGCGLAGHVMPTQVVAVVGDQPVGQTVRQVDLADQRVREQGVEDPRAPAAKRRIQCQVLVRRHGRHEPREQGFERWNRQGLRAGRPDFARALRSPHHRAGTATFRRCAC